MSYASKDETYLKPFMLVRALKMATLCYDTGLDKTHDFDIKSLSLEYVFFCQERS